jgi:hypothetical protein
VQLTALTYEDLGITVFAVRRSRRWLFLKQLQDRVYRMRISSNPRPTSVRWTKSKGLLGECWRELKTVELDVQRHFRGVGDVSRKEWRKLPKDTRRGLTYSDFLQIRGFQFVRAYPIIDSKGKYWGCLVVQVPCAHKKHVKSSDAEKVIERTCGTIAGTLASRSS